MYPSDSVMTACCDKVSQSRISSVGFSARRNYQHEPIMLIAAFLRPSCAAANIFACRHEADPDFVAAFGQFDQEPLAEAVMRRGQE